MQATPLHPGDICRTPFEPSGRVEVLSLESAYSLSRFRAAAVVRFVEDHPHGYKQGEIDCYFADELKPVKVR